MFWRIQFHLKCLETNYSDLKKNILVTCIITTAVQAGTVVLCSKYSISLQIKEENKENNYIVLTTAFNKLVDHVKHMRIDDVKRFAIELQKIQEEFDDVSLEINAFNQLLSELRIYCVHLLLWSCH